MKLYQQQWLEELNQCIEQSSTNPNFSTYQLVLSMNISLSSLHRKLEQLCGCTPSTYIKIKQLESDN